MYAPGILKKENKGDLSKLSPGMLVDFFIQHHKANKRGPHFDFRIGTPELGLFSWATNKHPFSEDKQEIIQTSLHEHSYGPWEGKIEKGYGAGTVSLDSAGKMLVTNKTDKVISLTTADKKNNARLSLVQPGSKYGDNYWLLVKKKKLDHPNVEKKSYKSIDATQAVKYLTNLPKSSIVQPKIDGALQFLLFGNDKIESISHRLAKQDGKPIIHTERIFGKVPHKSIPKELRNSIFLAEIYGAKGEKPIPQQETSGLLNSTIYKSLKDQKEKGIKLKGMLFGVAKINGNNLSFDTPYEERKQLIEQALKILPKEQFHFPIEAKTLKERLALWRKINNEKGEGVIIHPAEGSPVKIKVTPEEDVEITGIFSAEKGSKYDNNAAGGLLIKSKKGITTRVGTGLSDTLRKLIFTNPNDFIGRIARIAHQGEHSSGKFRAPVFINLHEG